MHGKRKIITFGEKKFEIEINRKIVLDVINQFNDYFANLISIARIHNDKKEQSGNNSDYFDFIETAIRTKMWGAIIGREETQADIARFALPKMLSMASGQAIQFAEKQADDIMSYAEENNAVDLLSETIENLIIDGFFTEEADEKPKITLTME